MNLFSDTTTARYLRIDRSMQNNRPHNCHATTARCSLIDRTIQPHRPHNSAAWIARFRRSEDTNNLSDCKRNLAETEFINYYLYFCSAFVENNQPFSNK